MKTERTEKLLPPGQGAAKWRLLPQGQVQGDPQGGRACPAARSQRLWLGLTKRAQAHGAGAGQAKKSIPQGWGQLQARPSRTTGTGHARTSAHRWRSRARYSTGTAGLETSPPPCQTGAEGPGLSLNRAPGPMGVGRPRPRLVRAIRALWCPRGLALPV